MSRTVSIAGRPISAEHPPYLIAEMSGNHNGDIRRAFQLLEAAKAAGADAVKLQTYTADTITIDHDSGDFRINAGPWAGKTLYALYQEAHTPWEWHRELFAKARELGLTIFSSPFDETAVDFLEKLMVPAYKIASFEAVDLPLIRRVAATGKPLIISTGMANRDEIQEAVDAARSTGNDDIVLLHCVSGYPTPAAEANLRTLPEMAAGFDAVVGLSDHTMGTAVSIAAVALGACVIEKHFTLRRADGGPDATFSLEPEELAALTSGCLAAWEALGRTGFERKPSEMANVRFRRSLYVVKNIAAGERFTLQNIRSIRPGFGLPPKLLPQILGKRAAVSLRRGQALALDHLSDKDDQS